jgi:hypothetical protein
MHPTTAMATKLRPAHHAQHHAHVKDVPPISRVVRSESWSSRIFYAAACRFFIDVPLDMTGCIHAGLLETVEHGLEPLPGGDLLLTDSLYRGAVLVEIARPAKIADRHVVELSGLELLSRELPSSGVRMRAELDELTRWSFDLGHQVKALYVRYARVPPGIMRPTTVYAALE